MTIPLVKEPKGEPFTEVCFFCGTPTKHWHENTNNPVCTSCAKEHKVGELPDHGQNVRAAKRKAKKKKQKHQSMCAGEHAWHNEGSW